MYDNQKRQMGPTEIFRQAITKVKSAVAHLETRNSEIFTLIII